MNNAYGLQSDRVIGLIKSAIDAGRVDAIVSSTDKNFLCPIGGSVVYGPSQSMAETISKHYAGRASSAPYIQLLISLLSMGVNGYKKLRDEQVSNRKLLQEELETLACQQGERVIRDENPVSAAFTLNTLKSENVKALGGHLYNLRVTGPRIVDPRVQTFGSCTEMLKEPYITMNAAIGSSEVHIKKAVEKLRLSIEKLKA